MSYQLIVSPRIGGQHGATDAVNGTPVKWKTTADAGPGVSQSLTNGLGATNAMVDANAAAPTVIYPAADFAKTARTALVGGYNDWYMPARDELELLYRAFKPSVTVNATGIRPPTGNGGDSKSYGTNANSGLDGTPYTADKPTLTSVTAFQTSVGTGEGFIATASYLSSTECEANTVWRQFFSSSEQLAGDKTGVSYYVRLVRREAIV